jgi:hypothetical protein
MPEASSLMDRMRGRGSRGYTRSHPKHRHLLIECGGMIIVDRGHTRSISNNASECAGRVTVDPGVIPEASATVHLSVREGLL